MSGLKILVGVIVILFLALGVWFFWPRKPAEFVISDLTVTPTDALTGDRVEVRVSVNNVGDLEGSYALTLRIDGEEVAMERVTVPGRATKEVIFYFQKNQAGTYIISVDGFSHQLLVKARIVEIPGVEPEISPGEQLHRRYEWDFKGKTYKWDVSIPEGLYSYFRGKTRPPTTNYSVYITHPRDDEYLRSLLESVEEVAERDGFTEMDKINFITSFIQALPYTPDEVSTPFDEYPRYPIETLVDNGGDCEDTSILLAALLDQMNYDVVLIAPPSHMAVGISGEGFSGSYYPLDGKRYFYIETTGEGWKIGQVPEEFKDSSATLHRLEPTPIFTHSWDAEHVLPDTLELSVTLKNEGTAPARDVYVLAGFDAGENKLWNAEESDAFTLPQESEKIARLRLTLPKNKYTRLVVQIIHEGFAVDQSYSNWFTT